MSFYGQVVNYLTRAFSKFKIGNKTVVADDYNDELTITGDNWISVSGNNTNKSITYSHSAAQQASSTLGSVSVTEADISKATNGSTVSIDLPRFDSKGHYKNSQGVTANINIKSALDRLTGAETKITTNESNINNLSKKVDVSGTVSAAISTAKSEALQDANKKLKEAKDYTDTKSSELLSTLNSAQGSLQKEIQTARGEAIAHANQIKQDILGDNLANTFDTLREVQDWVDTHGAETDELITSLKNEQTARENADSTLDNKIDKTKNLLEENIEETKSELASDIRNVNLRVDAANIDIAANQNNITHINSRIDTVNTRFNEVNNNINAVNNTINNIDKKHTNNYENNKSLISQNTLDIATINTSLSNLNLNKTIDISERISQVIQHPGGRIELIITDLPYEFPDEVKLNYNEETGYLTFPSYFKFSVTGGND